MPAATDGSGSAKLDGRDAVMIAHRLGRALSYGLPALQDTPALGHRCDNPLGQRLEPGHVQQSSHAENRQEWAGRRHALENPRGGPAAPNALGGGPAAA